jgi:outer membrane protein OmpA-like peptidoglycan-associated protein
MKNDPRLATRRFYTCTSMIVTVKKSRVLNVVKVDFSSISRSDFQTIALSTMEEDSLDMDLALTTNYSIVQVYFDSNQSTVKADNLDELNALYKLLLANPNLRMEINAYADARASDDYNLILSKKRGDWIVEYMVKKGIPADRFIVNAYGETKLIDESNDAVNRRAEIRVY